MIYKLNQNENKSEYRKVKRVTLADIGWNENDLENLISNNIFDLISSAELMTLFTQRARQEEPDILALDKNGDLYFFELKRWLSDAENILQVLRYGQLFGNSDYDELNELYKKYTKQANADLYSAHKDKFSMKDESSLSRDDFNRKQHFLIVVNGLDQKTIEAILFWKKNGLNINAIIYWVFNIGDDFFIEFNMYSPVENILEYENNYYVLNTNIKNNPENSKEMIREQKAAAYYPGWREIIQKFQKDDTIFLYESGKGIIAYGLADGKLQKADCDGNPEFEYFMKLNNFVELEKPISAAEMKSITNRGYFLATTMFPISEEAAKAIIASI